MSDYGIATTLDTDFADAVTRTRDALATQGFGVLTEIDVAATLKTKLDMDMAPYLILGACNPPLAHQAITADAAIGLLLPCNVVVRDLGPRRGYGPRHHGAGDEQPRPRTGSPRRRREAPRCAVGPPRGDRVTSDLRSAVTAARWRG